MRASYSKKTEIDPAQDKSRDGYRGSRRGTLRIVGIGPGDRKHLSLRAREAIKKSRVIAGYKTYIKLLGGLTKNKEIVSSGMCQERERVEQAIKKAQEGKDVCLISSGDPGSYGMAGLALEVLNHKQLSEIKIEIIPGIPALASCASLLGAPLMHDFAAISLSDLLTDNKLIMKRVKLAAQGDFAIVLYNPMSKKRMNPLKEAWKILMKNRPPQTPVGIVRNAYRDGQEVVITKLRDLLESEKIDMVTTIIIGNTKTYVKGKYMITPRGYVV